MEIEPFYYYYMMAKTPYLPSATYKLRKVQLIFTNKSISKTLWENDIPTIQNGRKL